jgi:molecular chaperone DnaK (HSP70)
VVRRQERRRSLEARAEHPGAGALTSSSAPGFVVGIDLGTTNCAVAAAEGRGAITSFDIPQLVAAGEVRPHRTLPSFLFFTEQGQRDSGAVALPWDPSPDLVAGVFAREEGALVPGRLISSAKSWLSNPHVDRTAALLPFTATNGTVHGESGARLSPVEASARLLAHIRDAWNHIHAQGDDAARLEQQQVVLTVPASFDEEARELTVEAATRAGFERLTLLEEPLAALYAWIAAHRRQLAQGFAGDSLILVADVGGGTTDFSLIRARVEGGELAFERIAIGEHLLLGGDNLDLALAAAVEQKLAPARLTLAQRQALRRKCTAAKEALLSSDATERVTITVLGSGRGVVGGGLTTELTRAEVVSALREGFLPLTRPDDLPARDRRVGLRELGLPYETEPAITRHLAAFLARAGANGTVSRMARPDAVLLNGGFFTPSLAQNQVLDALTAWFGSRPRVLENENPEAAVALGAAFYGRLRQDPARARRLLIRAGSARSYYVGVASEDGGRRAVCVIPRGTEEGSRFELEREFTVVSNQPAAFTLYSSIDRADGPGAIIDLAGGRSPDDVQRHAPLVTAFRYGKRSRKVPLVVRLSAAFTETGTLELWCHAGETGHKWRLAFNLRSVEADPLDAEPEPGGADSGVIVEDEAVERSKGLLTAVFGQGPSPVTPEALTGELETLIGHGKHAWPLSTIRAMSDTLLQLANGRAKGPAYEVRWLNLVGLCVRPGFGSALDEWRVSELRRIYAAGLAFPRETQNQVEWLVLWQRVSAGFTSGQQRELAQRVSGQLGLGQRKRPRINAQIDRESWRLLASLERLDAGQRARLGDELAGRIGRDPRNASWLWAIGRFGARQPLYGPLNGVVSPDVAERWIGTLLQPKELTADAASAIAQIGARTDDPARDIAAATAAGAAARLSAAGWSAAAEKLTAVVATSSAEAGRVFGEALPEGLSLVTSR